MKKVLFSTLISFLLMTSFVSCGDDNDGSSGCDLDELSKELIAKGEAYLDDRSVSNCIAYSKAIENFIEEAEGCPTVTEDQIESLEESLDELDCN